MRKLLLILMAGISILTSSAETVSQKQASQLAQLFFNEASKRVVAPPKLVYNGKKLTTDRLFTPFYVYNNMTGGFVIISAENKAFPILGFSLKENFDPNSIGEAETALLRSYAREIELIRYDSEPVEDAQWAWINYADYVDRILSAKYVSTDPIFTPSEADILVDAAERKDDAIYSDIYTPGQWETMIKEELLLKQSVPLVMMEGEKAYPAVIYGNHGNYFKIEGSKRNDWLMRLNATENISANMISAVVNPIEIPLVIENDIPFENLDEHLEEIALNEGRRSGESSIERIQKGERPTVTGIGGGRYEVTLPEPVTLVTVYNLGGGIVAKQKAKDTNIVYVDISPEPNGFYFISVIGESGMPYGFKIVR